MTDGGVMNGLLALAVLAAFALIIGGIWLLRRDGIGTLKGWLMIGAAVVALLNLWINMLPVPAG
jgi:hypothetical protein